MTGDDTVLLVGAGAMAVEYARVLQFLETRFMVMGRGAESAASFSDETGLRPTTGPLEQQIARMGRLPRTAIVAVNAMHLTEVTCLLARSGVERLLVEKPAALDAQEMRGLVDVVAETSAELRIGFNRRFLSSVRSARDMIAEDGGALSVKFDFSEPSRRIAALDKPQRELDTWFYGNSMHVVDLAFHLAGDLHDLTGIVAGGVSWNPTTGVFVGHARAGVGCLVSWHANWIGPGRWGIEVMTSERRLILQPLEELRVQDHAGFDERIVGLDSENDGQFKPGLLMQVRAFMFGEGDENLPDLEEHARRWPAYEAIRTGQDVSTHRESHQ